jgi:branched-subunit amino acid aminotransferase/4-amino-4-deoxychorismate lyase
MEPIALINGEFLHQSRASLALNDAGFVFGATITDLCRTFNGKLYRWPDHLARFRRSGELTGIRVPYSNEQITAWANELVQQNVVRAASVSERSAEQILVLFATPGPIGYYLGQPGGAGDGPPTFGMHTFPLPFERYRSLVEEGAALRIPTLSQALVHGVDPRIKHRSRLHWWLADRAVQRAQPGAQALLLGAGGHVTETASANFLIVKEGQVITPSQEHVLNGISLGVIEELCARLGIPIRFQPVTPQDALTAEEAILSSTPYCLAGVRSIDGQELPWPGPIMQRLVEAWSAEVGVDIHGQFRG